MNTCAPAFIALMAYSAWVLGQELIDTASAWSPRGRVEILEQRVALEFIGNGLGLDRAAHDADDLEARIAMIGTGVGLAHMPSPTTSTRTLSAIRPLHCEMGVTRAAGAARAGFISP